MVHVLVCLRDNQVVFEKIREFRVHFFFDFCAQHMRESRVIYDHTEDVCDPTTYTCMYVYTYMSCSTYDPWMYRYLL
jgi:hypothetical protein